MGHYLANFVVYTMAMTGLICFAVFVYKKVICGSIYSNSSNILTIEETLNLNPRKTLMIVKAGNERFLVASDVDKTSLISKLGTTDSTIQSVVSNEINTAQQVFTNDSANLQQRMFYDESAAVPNNIMNSVPQNIVFTDEQKTSLDEIYPKKNKRTGAQQQRRVQSSKENTVVLDFSKPKSHGLSAIKEMAKKINEL